MKDRAGAAGRGYTNRQAISAPCADEASSLTLLRVDAPGAAVHTGFLCQCLHGEGKRTPVAFAMLTLLPWMRRSVLPATVALLAVAPITRAQCPDGTPPPCKGAVPAVLRRVNARGWIVVPAKGSSSETKIWYDKVLDLWSAADAEFQPVVERVRKARAALAR